MTHAVRSFLLVSLFGAALGCHRGSAASAQRSPVVSAPLPSAPTTQETIGFLASDELEGRGVGTNGLNRAAEYIASRFDGAGLKPLPALDGYFQRFEMTTGASVSKDTVLTIADNPLVLDKSFRPLSFSASGTFDAPVVFVGYGIATDKHGYNDYASVDVRGKIALAMRFEPHNDGGKSRFVDKGYSDDATFKQKARLAAERGAVALLLVNPPRYHGQDNLVPFAGMFTEANSKLPIAQVSVEAAEDLLKRGGAAGLTSLQDRIDGGGKPASVELSEVRAAGEFQIEHKRAAVSNVVAVAPGLGPLKDEYVVVGAHYDHVGKSRMFSAGGKEGEIHNGADDNASGVTAMLSLAHAFAGQPTSRRSVVFVAFTAEEWGLIGSQHFVEHPPVPLKQTVAMINMDMVGRVRNDTLYLGGMGTAAGLEAIVRAADEASPLAVKDIGKGGLGPSDHMSFALKKIPVLFFFSGLHPDYHRPSDDADKINYAAMEQVVAFGRDVLDKLATGPRQPYIAVADNRQHVGMTGAVGGNRVALGVVPDYSAMESTGGVRITGTSPGSPAAAAGLQEGDVITRFGDKTIDDLMDLSNALANAKAGDKVKLNVRRDGKNIAVDTTLAERKE